VKIRYFVDVSTLFEPHFTGVSSVTADVVKWLIDRACLDLCFFRGDELIERGAIDLILAARSGLALRALDPRQVISGMVGENLRAEPERISVGIFCNAKTLRSVFDFEVQII